MKSAERTRENLVNSARCLFWQRGYSNVPLRDIASDAKVDVALISRYFGNKMGLFAATLEGAFEWPELFDEAAASPVDVAVNKFAKKGAKPRDVSVIQMIVMNGSDPEVRGLVRNAMCENFVDPLCARVGDDKSAANVAMFISVLLGVTIARNDLELPGLVDQTPEEFARLLHHMVSAAMSFRD